MVRSMRGGLDDDADHVHVPECAGPEKEGLFGAEEPEEGGDDDEGDCEMAYAVWEPADDVQGRVGEAGKDVRNVRAVEDGLKSG